MWSSSHASHWLRIWRQSHMAFCDRWLARSMFLFEQIKLWKIFGHHLMGLGHDKNADVKSEKFFKAEAKETFHDVLAYAASNHMFRDLSLLCMWCGQYASHLHFARYPFLVGLTWVGDVVNMPATFISQVPISGWANLRAQVNFLLLQFHHA